MGMNDTPSGERLHIGFFGRRNAGKSSVVNAVTGQDLAVVSDTLGTTTDPVQKAMELLPLGPVMIIDTPGFDDEGTLGLQRVARTRRILNRTDVAVLVADCTAGVTAHMDGRGYVTSDSHIQYISSIREGMILSEGQILHRGRSLVTVLVRLTAEDGRLLAQGTFNMYCIEQKAE